MTRVSLEIFSGSFVALPRARLTVEKYHAATIVLLGFVMLKHSRFLANSVRSGWERLAVGRGEDDGRSVGGYASTKWAMGKQPLGGRGGSSRAKKGGGEVVAGLEETHS